MYYGSIVEEQYKNSAENTNFKKNE